MASEAENEIRSDEPNDNPDDFRLALSREIHHSSNTTPEQLIRNTDLLTSRLPGDHCSPMSSLTTPMDSSTPLKSEETTIPSKQAPTRRTRQVPRRPITLQARHASGETLTRFIRVHLGHYDRDQSLLTIGQLPTLMTYFTLLRSKGTHHCVNWRAEATNQAVPFKAHDASGTPRQGWHTHSVDPCSSGPL